MIICRIERPVTLGITNPYVVECDDGKKYIAKFPGNPEGTRALINEYICGELAKILQLPIPNFKLVKINNIDEFSSQLDGIKMINGTVFCSEMLEKVAPVSGYFVLSKVTNSIAALETLIFDVIIGNEDRNQGNFLINFKNNSFVIIDHSHVFENGVLWTEQSINSLIGRPINVSRFNSSTYNTLILCNNINENKVKIKDFIKLIKKIDSNTLDTIISQIPSDWAITNGEKKSLKMFILDRVNRIEEIYKLLNIGGD